MIAAAAAVKLAIAARWGLLADEAYHVTWSYAPAAGYYDQPPLIAWWLALVRLVGDDPVLLRAGPIALWLAATAALAPFARDRVTWWVWALGLPPLALLTNLAVPDALLLSAWAGGLAGALHGGRGWLVAGVCGGLASLAKYTGVCLVPLLIFALPPSERRERWPWLALVLAIGLWLPNLVWNASHEWVTVRFVLGDGLHTVPAPGLAGMGVQIRDQIGVVTPLAWGIGVLAAVRAVRTSDRADRMLAFSSVPLWLGFAFAAVGGRPEAHWPAPTWIGAGLLASRTGGRAARWAAISAAAATVLLLVHVERPLVALAPDPATRFAEGEVLAAEVGHGPPLFAERYQEAALLTVSGHGDVAVLSGCARRSQSDLAPVAVPAVIRFVRPSTSGPPDCLRARCAEVSAPLTLGGRDDAGRPVGRWDLFTAFGCR